jgi:hypothetical protein
MSNVSSKQMSEKDASQVLRSVFNDNDMTLSTGGFLDGKVGHRIKTKYISGTIDENLFFDEISNLTCGLTTASPVITVPNTIGLAVGQYVLLDVGTAGIPDDTTILSIDNTTNQITLSDNVTATTGNYTVHFANLVKRLRLCYNNSNHDILLDAARIE